MAKPGRTAKALAKTSVTIPGMCRWSSRIQAPRFNPRRTVGSNPVAVPLDANVAFPATGASASQLPRWRNCRRISPSISPHELSGSRNSAWQLHAHLPSSRNCSYFDEPTSALDV